LIHIKLNMYRSRYGGDLTYAKKFDSILHFFIPKETMKRLGKDGKPDRGEPETSVTFFSPPFYGAFWRRLVLRGWGGELLRRDNVDKYRATWVITPVRLYHVEVVAEVVPLCGEKV
jgi:hypothetical protein